MPDPAKLRSVLLLTALLSAPSCRSTDDDAAAPTAAMQDPRTILDQRMEWWRQARFGMFIHWGLYAIPAGKWGEKDSHGEWIRTTAEIPLGEYDEFQPQWNPTQFDAEAWASMAAAAGMKYLVITSKHHDGFCLWDSAQTDWDVGNTPHGRDILRELAAACDRHGVVFCTYHSIMDWHHPDYLPRRPWEKDRSSDGADFDRFEKYLHAQVTEIVQNYRPGVMWFDGEWESTWNHERGLRLFELCRQLDPKMIVNNRVDVHRAGMQGFAKDSEAVGDFQTPEQEIPATGVPGVDWESCMTMNSHWGWNAYDTQWKSTTTLLRNLIDIASKGGNYLLNVGPRADGTFPPDAVLRLREIGQWMDKNGEAIWGTSASVFDDLKWGRCTVRREGRTSKLYLHVFDLPADGILELRGIANHVTKSPYLLADPRRQYYMPMSVGSYDPPNTIRVAVDRNDLDPHATVIVVEVEGIPVVYKPPVITAVSELFVNSVDVDLTTPTASAEVRFTTDGSAPSANAKAAVGPVRVTATCTVKAATFRDAMQVSDVVERTFVKVDPVPPVQPVAPNAGLHFTRHTADWTTIPENRRDLVADLSGTTTEITAGKAPGEHVALRFSGFLRVPEDELYRFRLTSDDGSKLWIAGQLVVDNDGPHGSQAKDGAIALAAGLHQIELVWFNITGGAELSLSWAQPDAPFTKVPPAALCH